MKYKNILILTAMESEFLDCLGDVKAQVETISALNIQVHLIQLKDKTIYLAQTGVGPINASVVTALITQHYSIDLVLLVGLGGSLDTRVKIGDVCIGTGIIQHDAICSFDDRIEQMSSGELHLSVSEEKRADIRFYTNQQLNEALGNNFKDKGIHIHAGDILSGSEFTGSKARKVELKTRFKNAILVEMEACGVALVCKKLSAPLMVIKIASDSFNELSDVEYKEFMNSKSSKSPDIFDFVRAL